MTSAEYIIPALLGMATAAVTSLIGFWISNKNLRAEYRAKRNVDFTTKQISACEALWTILEPVSRSHGENRVIVYRDEQPYVVLCAAQEFYTSLCKVFYSTCGLYYSKPLRDELFDLRDFLMEEFLSKAQNGQTELLVAKGRVKKLDGKVQQLRIAIRAEIGVENLQVAHESPVN